MANCSSVIGKANNAARNTRQAFQIGPLKLRVNGLEPAISLLLVSEIAV
jgi:hypothetical protein